MTRNVIERMMNKYLPFRSNHGKATNIDHRSINNTPEQRPLHRYRTHPNHNWTQPNSFLNFPGETRR